MDEQEIQEFSLEDIIKEFSDAPEGESQKEPELTEETPAEETEEETAEETPAEASAQVEVPAVTDATIRLDRIPDTQGKVRNAQLITDEEDEQPIIPVEENKTEPYSSEWEPEYEQPIAEYVPQPPLLFPRRSRLQELKRKLVAGPEREYYALSEKGLGKLQFAIFASFVVVLLCAAATALYALGMVPENRMRLMVFGQFFAMLLSALLGSNQLMEGAVDLFRKRFSLNTLLVFTFVICCVDGVVCLQQLRVPCCAAFSLQVTMSLWNAYQKRNTRLGELDTMRKATRLDKIGVVEDYHPEGKGLLRGEGMVEDFTEIDRQPSRQEKCLSVYALVALCVSVVVGIVAGVLHGLHTGIQVAAVTVLAAMPASAFITLSRPMAVLERRLHALGAVLCGWQGVERICGKAMFPVDHNDLFPVNAVKMNGVKFFGSRPPDFVISYAAALVGAGGGSLEPLFSHLLESRNGIHYTVENFCVYEDGGIGGDINDEPVLAGSLSFLKEMGVEVPEGIRVTQAVCLAIDGELSGLFAITYEKDRASAAGMTTLCGYRGLKTVLTTEDFMLTPGFIRSKFGVNPKRIMLLDRQERLELHAKELEPDTPAAALITGDGLAPFAYAATGARALKNAWNLGVIVHMIGGILGMAMMLVLAILGETELLTPANMFLYELVWILPALLISEWTRTI